MTTMYTYTYAEFKVANFIPSTKMFGPNISFCKCLKITDFGCKNYRLYPLKYHMVELEKLLTHRNFWQKNV